MSEAVTTTKKTTKITTTTTTTTVVDGAAVTETVSAIETTENQTTTASEDMDIIPEHIERLPKPDKAAFDHDIAKIDAEIKTLQARTAAIRTEMDALKAGRGGGFGEQIQAAKAAYSALRAEKDGLIQQRNQITARLRQSQDKKDAALKVQRSSRATLKFQTEQEFDDAINALRHQQETRSMSLADEKKLVKEIEQLQVQRRQVSKVAEDRSVVDKQVESVKEIRAEQQQKNAEIDAVQAKLVAQKAALDELYRQNDEEKKQDRFPILAKERKDIKEQLDAQFTALKARRAEFKAANDRYYENIRLVRKKKELERKKEDERRRLEYEAKLAEYEQEMAKIHPYQDEMDMCDAIVAFMEKSFAKELKEHEAEAAAAAAPKELDGLKPFKRDEEDFIVLGKKKKGGKKEGGKKKRSAKVILPISQLESFATIGLLPPATMDAVAEAVKAVKEKKVWFNAQTSRPKPAADATPAKAAPAKAAPAKADAEAKPKAEAAKAVTSPKKKTSNKKFNAADTSAFPSLGASPVVGASPSSWGPGMAVVAPPVPVAVEVEETVVEETS